MPHNINGKEMQARRALLQRSPRCAAGLLLLAMAAIMLVNYVYNGNAIPAYSNEETAALRRSWDCLARAQAVFPPNSSRAKEEASYLFHVSPGGTRIEGAFFRAMVDLSERGWVKEHFGCRDFHENFTPLDKEKCTWCPRGMREEDASQPSFCVDGRLTIGGFYRDDHWEHGLRSLGLTDLMETRSYTERRDSHNRMWNTMYFLCELGAAVPPGVPGVVAFQGRPKMAHVVAPREVISPESKDFVCTRGMYGRFLSAHRLAAFARHYVEAWGFASVFVYEIGMLFGPSLRDLISADPVLSRLHREGRIVLVDLREALQREYGLLYQDVLLFSAQLGQLLTFQDCYARTKALGARWVLTVDVDEYLTNGRDRLVAPKSFRSFAEEHEQAHRTKNPFATNELAVIQFEHKWLVSEPSDTSVCDMCGGGGAAWDKDGVAKRHREVEYPKHASVDVDKDVYGSTGAGGKYAVRVDLNPRAFGLGTHYVEDDCVFPETRKTADRTAIVAFEDAYIRHYRGCGNQRSPCEAEPQMQMSWHMFA